MHEYIQAVRDTRNFDFSYGVCLIYSSRIKEGGNGGRAETGEKYIFVAKSLFLTMM